MRKKQSDFFSVIVPVEKLSYHLLFENIPAFEKQIFKKFELIVLSNEHSQYDLKLLKKHSWLRIVPTGNVTKPAEKRNLGVKAARGSIIAFIDDDAYPRLDWLQEAVKKFKKSVSAVCGPGILPENTNIWEKIFDQVITSWLGSGGYSYRFIPQKERFVDDYPSMNFLIKKKVFDKLGGFKGNYWPGEDSKLCEDLVYKLKGKILYSPKVVVYHHRRKDLKSFLKQHGNYGFHRGAFFAHGDKNSRRISYLVPTFFVGYLVFIILFSIFLLLFQLTINNQQLAIFYLPLIFYFFYSVQLFFKTLLDNKNLLIAFLSPIVLFLTHLTYGIIFIKGFIKGFRNKNNIYD